MKRVIVWQRTDTVGLEYAEVEIDPLLLVGDVVLVENGERWAVTYRVEYDDNAVTTRASVPFRQEGSVHDCTLIRSATGLWTVNRTPRPELDGLVDVDLSITPSTNTAPIHRLGLAIGQDAQMTAAWVTFPSLDVVPLCQIYRRVEPTAYEYQAPDLSFDARLECDADGVVRTYGSLWRQCP